jgi:hypothetical protein
VSGIISPPGFASPLISTIERRVGSALDSTWIDDSSSGRSRGYSFGPESAHASGGSTRFATRFDSHEEDRDSYFDSSAGQVDDLDDPFGEQPRKTEKSRFAFARGRSLTNPPPFSKRDSLDSFKSEPRNTASRRARGNTYTAPSSPFDDSHQTPSWEQRRRNSRPRDSFDEDLLTFAEPNADGGRFSFTATRDATVLPSDFALPSPSQNDSFRFKGRSTPQMDAALPSSSLKTDMRRPIAATPKSAKGTAIALYDFAGAEVSWDDPLSPSGFRPETERELLRSNARREI